ncbi:MAG: copper chaperone PCu(A)C [Deltaproteobacteria bacterium]
MLKRCLIAAAAFIAAVPVFSFELLAHANLDVKTASQGSLRAAVRVPHGCDGSATVAVKLVVPEGIIGVKPAPKAGWTVETVKGPYAKAYDYYHGKVSEGVKEIIWRGGPLMDEHFDEFIFIGFVSDAYAAGAQVPFPVTQECEKGQIAWSEVAAPGADSHSLKYPAPILKIVAKDGANKAAAAGLAVANAWARATPGGAKVGAGYLEIVNGTAADDTLLSVSSPVAGKTEIHEMKHDDGVMKMRALTDGLTIPAGKTISLSPGGLHIMFLDLAAPLVAGQKFDLELTFKTAGKVTVPVSVGEIAAPKAADPHANHH